MDQAVREACRTGQGSSDAALRGRKNVKPHAPCPVVGTNPNRSLMMGTLKPPPRSWTAPVLWRFGIRDEGLAPFLEA